MCPNIIKVNDYLACISSWSKIQRRRDFRACFERSIFFNGSVNWIYRTRVDFFTNRTFSEPNRTFDKPNIFWRNELFFGVPIWFVKKSMCVLYLPNVTKEWYISLRLIVHLTMMRIIFWNVLGWCSRPKSICRSQKIQLFFQSLSFIGVWMTIFAIDWQRVTETTIRFVGLYFRSYSVWWLLFQKYGCQGLRKPNYALKVLICNG